MANKAKKTNPIKPNELFDFNGYENNIKKITKATNDLSRAMAKLNKILSESKLKDIASFIPEHIKK